MYFHYFVIISLNKKAWPFILRNFNILYQRMLCARFGRNLSRGLCRIWKFLKSLQTDGQRTGLYVTRVSETRHRFFARSAHLCISTGPIIEWIKIKFGRGKLQITITINVLYIETCHQNYISFQHSLSYSLALPNPKPPPGHFFKCCTHI